MGHSGRCIYSAGILEIPGVPHPEKEWHCPWSVIDLALPRHSREHLPGMQQGFLHPPQELPLHSSWCLPPHALQKMPPSKPAHGAARFQNSKSNCSEHEMFFPSSIILSGWTPWYLMHCTPSIVIQGHFCLVGR